MDRYKESYLGEMSAFVKCLLEDTLPPVGGEDGLMATVIGLAAMKSIEEVKDLDAVKEGMHLIYNMFKEYLGQQGVREIEAMHQEFDTDLHDAVTKIPTPEKKLKGKVVDVIERGYFLNEKVLRYVKVVIGE